MRHFFIINPIAGREDATNALRREIAEVFSGEEVSIAVSQYKGHITELVQEAGESGKETRIYACGGDGTFNEALQGAVGYDNLSLTSIPRGSGNDFIKQFANPGGFHDLSNFTDCRVDDFDLMQVNDRYSANICSVGFDARIGTAIDAYRRLPLLNGPRAYTASVVVNLIKGVAKPCRVEIDGQVVVDQKLTLVCVCNGSWYGGGYNPVPDADMTDGILEVLVVDKVSRLKVAQLISAYQKGQYSRFPELITHYRTNDIRIVTPQPEPVNLDGELLMTDDVRITVLPKKMRLFSPRAAWTSREECFT